MTNTSNNPIVKRLIQCFDINDYRKRGGGEIKERIYKTLENLSKRNDRKAEIKNTIKTISSKNETHDNTNSMDTYELVELLMYKINQKMPRKCEECKKFYIEPVNPLKWPSIECDTCYVPAHMCLQSASPYIPFIYEDNQSLIKMIGFKWRCCECNNSIEKNKLYNIINDKIMKESIKKYRMLRRDERTKTKNRTESGKTSDPTKQSQINYSQKTQSHSPESETVDLTDEGMDEDMDVDDLDEPLSLKDITTIESRLGLDRNSAESLKPKKQVLDNVLEYGVGMLEKEIGNDAKKIGVVGPAVSEFIMQGEDPKNPEIYLKSCRNMLDRAMKDQENTILFINYNKNIHKLGEGGSHWSILHYDKKENKFFHHDPIVNTNKKYAVMMAKKLKMINNKINATVTEIQCPQQNNSYDCGIYSLLYIKGIVQKILKGNSPNIYAKNEITDHDADKLRRDMYKQITTKIRDEESKGKDKGNKPKTRGRSYSESEKNKNTQKFSKNITEKKKDKNTENKTHNRTIDDIDRNKKKSDECWYYTNRKCVYGDDCDRVHKDTCLEYKKKRNM